MSASSLGSNAIIGEFFLRLEQNLGETWIPAVSMLFNSDQESETYRWLNQSPQMREWLGGREAKSFLDSGITIKNKTYEATLQVLVDEIRRDKTGQVMVRIAELAQRTNSHWAKLLSQLIIDGPSTVCSDGQFYFDTDHVFGDNQTSQSNDISVDISALPAQTHGAVTNPSSEEASLSILKGIEAISGFLDDQSEPMNENARDYVVMVPISLFSACLSGTQSANYANGGDNVLAMSNFNVNVVANARLNAWTDKFAIFRTDGNASPFIRQEEEGVTVAAQAEGSQEEFLNNRHLYGVKAIRNVGYGFWQHSCLVTMT